ncbi:metalloexopeptidase activity [Sparganum proliferum]
MSVFAAGDVLGGEYDVVVFVNDKIHDLGVAALDPIEKALIGYENINPKIETTLDILPFTDHPCQRMIFSPTGMLNGDTDDSRNIYDAAEAGIKKALSINCRSPLLVLGPIKSAPRDVVWMEDEFPLLNAVLGALHALYMPLELREVNSEKPSKFDKLGVFNATQKLLFIAAAIEEGRRVARDIGGSDPERMAAPKIAEYLKKEFQNVPEVSVDIQEVEEKAYPLMAAVNRAASGSARHRGKVAHLTYKSSTVDTSLFLVGKGITYDTGGNDIKAGGIMAGMHRDKCGAAAIAGFFKTLSILKPPGLQVFGYLALVRNSCGSNGYVADELITSRAGCRVRVGNTDAEGRMVMTDLLCEAKEQAVNSKNPFLFTIATLTGHVIRAYKFYTALMDNGPARKLSVSQKLQKAGERVSDMAEISTVRREDFEFNKGHSELEDVLQCNNLPSSGTPRGHQFPAAFMTIASGLDKHGLGREKPLPYTHIDVCGSAGLIGTTPTAAPMMMLTSHFVLPRL